MKIIESESKKTLVLLPTKLTQYYLRLDGGALVNKSFDPDLTPAFKSGEFEEHTVAQKADLVILNPKRPGYEAVRPMTLGDFYQNELFREIFCLPIQSWVQNKTGEYVEKEDGINRFEPNVLGTFMIRGRSLDEYTKMIAPFEIELFNQWVKNLTKLSKEYETADAFVRAKSSEVYSTKIFTFELVLSKKGKKPHYYTVWSYRDPQNETEKELLEIGAKISQNPELSSLYLVNPIAEKAHQKALEAAPTNGNNNGHSLRPGMSNHSLPATA